MARRCSATGIVLISERGLTELLGDLGFRRAQDDAGLALAFGLRLARHGVLQSAAGICTSRISTDCTVMPHGLVFSSRMRCSSLPSISRSVIIWCSSWRPIDSRSAVCALNVDGLREVLHFEDGLLRVPDHPEDDGVHVDRHGVARQRGFGRDVGDAHALVHVAAQRIDDRDDVEHARVRAARCTCPAAARPPSPTGRPCGWRTAGRGRSGTHTTPWAPEFCMRALSPTPDSNRNDKQGHPHGAGSEGRSTSGLISYLLFLARIGRNDRSTVPSVPRRVKPAAPARDTNSVTSLGELALALHVVAFRPSAG